MAECPNIINYFGHPRLILLHLGQCFRIYREREQAFWKLPAVAQWLKLMPAYNDNEFGFKSSEKSMAMMRKTSELSSLHSPKNQIS